MRVFAKNSMKISTKTFLFFHVLYYVEFFAATFTSFTKTKEINTVNEWLKK